MDESDNLFVNMDKIPRALLSETFEFSRMEAATDDEQVFSIADRSVWKLASSLWDDITLPDLPEAINEDEVGKLKESLRREYFSSWLRWALNSSKNPLVQETMSATEKIWNYLVFRRTDLAIEEALKSKNFRLATLLAQINGPSSAISIKRSQAGVSSEHTYFGGDGTDYGVFDDICTQLSIWQKSALPFIDTNLSRIWKILSGNIELWDGNIYYNFTEWKQYFGLFFWYGHGGHLSIHDVTKIYASLSGGNGKQSLIPAPQPYHAQNCSTNDLDVCFNLIQLFVDDSFPIESALKPGSFSSNLHDYLFPWIVYTILSKVKCLRDFSDVKAVFTEHKVTDNENQEFRYPVVSSVSLKGDMLTLRLVTQLEMLGQWKWAIFVALFLSDHFQRAIVIQKILGRNYPIEDMSGSTFHGSSGDLSPDWIFLVNQLKIPTNWIHESRALRSRAFNQPLQEAMSLFDANLFDSCHYVIMVKIAPVSLFSGNPVYINFKQIIHSFAPS